MRIVIRVINVTLAYCLNSFFNITYLLLLVRDGYLVTCHQKLQLEIMVH